MSGRFLAETRAERERDLPGRHHRHAAGAVACGVFGGHCAAAPARRPEPNASPRVAGPGAISPVDGVAENNEFCPDACADAACGYEQRQHERERRPQPARSGDCGCAAHDAVVFGPNRGDFKPIGRFVTPTPLC